MAFIHDLGIGESISVGDYEVSILETAPGDQPVVKIRSIGPGGEFVTEIDRATWLRPESQDTRPNSPQYRRDPALIHVGVPKRGKVGQCSSEICIEAPKSVPISV